MKGKFTPIPKELIKLLLSGALNNTEMRIILFLADKIYGWNKTSDKISNSQFEKALGLSHQTISTTLKRLKLVGITLLVKKGTSKKSPSEWTFDFKDIERKLVGIAGLVKYDKEKLVGTTLHTIETITKEKETTGKIFSLKSQEEVVLPNNSEKNNPQGGEKNKEDMLDNLFEAFAGGAK